MAESGAVGFDGSQVKKAVHALLAYQKNKANANSLLLNEHDRIALMLTVWKIPHRPQVIKIPLPHGIRPESFEVCLFTKDEPGMSYDQTEKFYRKLLSQHGITQITEVIPLQKLKKEYKPFEAKRRLLGNFDMFLADDRIRRFLPSQLGKHFYKEKREPISVDLKAKNLAAKLNRFIQGTQLHITNTGCCYSIRVGHTGMDVDAIVENTAAVATVLARKLPMGWKNVKVLHLKTQTSVALPVYNSALGNLDEVNAALVKQKREQRKKKSGDFLQVPEDSTLTSEVETAPVEQPEEEEEVIPELVPIQPTVEKEEKKKTKGNKTPAKKPKAGDKRQAPAESDDVPSTPKSVKEKRKVRKVKDDGLAEKPKKKTPLKLKDTEDDEQDSLPKSSSLKKTPKRTAVKSSVKLTKSAKKAPQTPKQKQKKKMKTPQSV